MQEQIDRLTRERDEAQVAEMDANAHVQAAREHITRLRGLLREAREEMGAMGVRTPVLALLVRIDAALGGSDG